MRTLILLFVIFTTSCAGSTEFLNEEAPELTLAAGITDTVVLEMEAIGSHAGSYEFTATVTSGEGLTATVDPTKADVDGIIEVTVTVTATEDAPAGTGLVFVEGRSDDLGAGTSIRIEVIDQVGGGS